MKWGRTLASSVISKDKKINYIPKPIKYGRDISSVCSYPETWKQEVILVSGAACGRGQIIGTVTHTLAFIPFLSSTLLLYWLHSQISCMMAVAALDFS